MTNENLVAFVDLISDFLGRFVKMYYQTKAWLESIADGSIKETEK